MTSHLRNKTKSTGTIAAFRNFHKRIVRRCRQYSWGRLVVEIRRALISKWNNRKCSRIGLWIANSQYFVYLTCADERIDLRKFSLKLITITLYQTAGYDQPFCGTFSFQTGGFQDCVDRFLLGRIDEPTGINQDRFRFVRIRRYLITTLL